INGRALSTSSVKKPVNFKVNDEYLKSFNNQQVRDYHNSNHRKDYDFSYSKDRNRWYDQPEGMMNMRDKCQEMKEYKNYMNTKYRCGPPSKLKVVGSVLGGIFVITHLPSIFTLVAGGALGVAAYRWMSFSKRYRDNPSFSFQYPDTTSIIKNAFKDPSSFRYFMNEPNGVQSKSKDQVPDMKNISWSVFHQMFPNVGDRALKMQKEVEKLRETVISRVQFDIANEESEFNKYIRQIIAQNNNGNSSFFDAKLLTFEPYADVKFHSNDGLIHIEMVAKYPSNNFGLQENRFLFYAEGKLVNNTNNNEPNSVQDKELIVTKLSAVCLKTWKAMQFNLS
ncbi:hypothetical protein K502DRAFT_354033, partial [Neoconidiobolus thromboides FSU 785]